MSTETVTDDLTHLDFHATLPCEGMGHDKLHIPRGHAIWIQHGTCPNCQAKPVMDICEGGRQYRLMCDRVICSRCSKASPVDQWGFRFEPIERTS